MSPLRSRKVHVLKGPFNSHKVSHKMSHKMSFVLAGVT